jgi:hypothetical protein
MPRAIEVFAAAVIPEARGEPTRKAQPRFVRKGAGPVAAVDVLDAVRRHAPVVVREGHPGPIHPSRRARMASVEPYPPGCGCG